MPDHNLGSAPMSGVPVPEPAPDISEVGTHFFARCKSVQVSVHGRMGRQVCERFDCRASRIVYAPGMFLDREVFLGGAILGMYKKGSRLNNVESRLVGLAITNLGRTLKARTCKITVLHSNFGDTRLCLHVKLEHVGLHQIRSSPRVIVNLTNRESTYGSTLGSVIKYRIGIEKKSTLMTDRTYSSRGIVSISCLVSQVWISTV